MARLGAAARAAGTLRLSHVARNNGAIEGTRIIDLARASNFANWTEPAGVQESPDLVRDRETAASARTLWPATEACQPSTGWSSSTRLRLAVAKPSEYCNRTLMLPASDNPNRPPHGFY